MATTATCCLRPPSDRAVRLGRERGVVYIGVLFATFVMGVSLAAVGEVWSVQSRREREAELLFVGNEYRRALVSFSQQTPAQSPRYPLSLDELLRDPRQPGLRRHLRKLYADPITRRAEWALVRGPDNRIRGVHSMSRDASIKVAGFAYRDRAFEGRRRYDQWVFGVDLPPNLAPAGPATARIDTTSPPGSSTGNPYRSPSASAPSARSGPSDRFSTPFPSLLPLPRRERR